MEWQQPPAAKRGKTATKWSKIAEQLRNNPNEWAKIGTVKFASQGSIIGKTHGIKVITRKSEDIENAFDLYGMFEQSDAS
jgi:hypothetical protein